MCPVLGKEDAEAHSGPCPDHLQSPQGKVLKISFIGLPPYIFYNEAGHLVGGSEVNIVELFAEKFNFTPTYINASSRDIVQGIGSSQLNEVKVEF